MNDDGYIKKYVERIGKTVFGSFGVYVGISIIANGILLVIGEAENTEIIMNPIVVLAVMIFSFPVLWKYMK